MRPGCMPAVDAVGALPVDRRDGRRRPAGPDAGVPADATRRSTPGWRPARVCPDPNCACCWPTSRPGCRRPCWPATCRTIRPSPTGWPSTSHGRCGTARRSGRASRSPRTRWPGRSSPPRRSTSMVNRAGHLLLLPAGGGDGGHPGGRHPGLHDHQCGVRPAAAVGRRWPRWTTGCRRKPRTLLYLCVPPAAGPVGPLAADPAAAAAGRARRDRPVRRSRSPT